MNVNCTSETCDYVLNSKCVFYEGVALPYAGVNTNDSLEAALQKINTAFQNVSGGGGAGVWGSITGLIGNQTDLITYINNYTPVNRTLTINGVAQDLSSDRSWTVGTGDMLLSATQTNSGAKTFLDATLLMRNVANTFSSRFTNTNTAARTYTLPNTSGTILLGNAATSLSGSTAWDLGSTGAFSVAANDGTTISTIGIGNGTAGNLITSESVADSNLQAFIGVSDPAGGIVIGSTSDAYISEINWLRINQANAIYEDTKASPNGIRYQAAGYVTDARSLTDKAYVDAAVAAASIRISGLLAANGTNTIDNAAFAQNWQWNSLTSGTGLLLSSSSTAAASGSQTVFRVNQTGANASSGQTTYSGYFSNTKTGTTSTNYAVYASASGGATANYGLFAFASGASTTNYAIFASASGGTTNRALYINQGTIYIANASSLTFNSTGPISWLGSGVILTPVSASTITWGMSGPGVNETSFSWNILSSAPGAGTSRHFYIGGGSYGLFAPSSGSANLTHYEFAGGVNQTGGATGTFTGFAMNPVLTSAYKVYGFRYNPSINNVTTDHWAFYADAGSYGMAASGYFNWGTTAGTSGYGFRDNLGTMEFKNSAGAWAAFGTIKGSTGSTDNAILRADGTGGVTLQDSALIIDDLGNLSLGTDGNLTRSIASTGTDPNINLQLQSKGTGNVRIFANGTDVAFSGAGTQKIIFLNSGNGTFSGADVTGSTGGNLILKGGDALSGVFKGGDISILGGTPFGGGGNATIQIGSATDNIKLGVSSTAGYVWTATDTLGNGTWAASSGGGIGGSTGAVDNSILRADGTGGSTLQNSNVYISDTADLTLGNSSLAGSSRLITIDSSVGTADLMLEGLGTGYVYATGGRFAVNNSRTSLYTSVGINSTTSLMRMFATYWNSSATAQVFEILAADGISGLTTGQNILFKAGNGFGTGNTNGGNTYIEVGSKNGSGLDGNIGLLTSSVANWQSMERGVYLGNRVTAPTAGLANGVALFAEDSNSSSEFYVTSESGAKVNISGLLEPITESGTSFSLNETHRNKVVLCTNSGAITVTVNAGKAAGWNCLLLATNATGTISLTASGTTINGTTATTAQFETLSIVHYGSENYLSKLG